VVSPNANDRFAGITSYYGTSVTTTSAWLDFISKAFKDVCIVSDVKDVLNTDKLYWDPSNEKSLIYDKKLVKKLKKCVKSDKRFIVMPFVLAGFSRGDEPLAHMNIIIYDKFNNSVERFEPHGKMNYGFEEADQKKFDMKINSDLKKFFDKKLKIPDLVYISPKEYCSAIGLQTRQESEADIYKDVANLNSFCSTWSIFYAMHRLLNPDMDQAELIRLINVYFNKYPKKISEFIRDYTFHLNEKIAKL